jgi:hypothetical protein
MRWNIIVECSTDNTFRHRTDPQCSAAEAPRPTRAALKDRAGCFNYHVFCDYCPEFHSVGYAPVPEAGYAS